MDKAPPAATPTSAKAAAAIARDLAREYMVGKLIASASKRWRTLALPYAKLSKDEQETLLAGTREDVEEAVRSAVELIAGDGRFVYRASVDKIAFDENGVKATISLPNTPQAHDLADRAGGTVLIVNEDGRQYLNGEDLIKASDDQKPLFDASAEPSAVAQVTGIV